VSAPIEGKVSAQAIVNLAATAFTALLTWGTAVWFYGLPNTAAAAVKAVAEVPAQILGIYALIPTAAGFYAGYRARHTPRPDLRGSAAAAGLTGGQVTTDPASEVPGQVQTFDHPASHVVIDPGTEGSLP